MDQSFFYEYFVKPIVSPQMQGYNLVNTAVYIILLVIACSLIYFALKKKVEFNYKFFIALMPYIFFGISMRVIMHQIEGGSLSIYGIFKTANPFDLGFWFFTPGIWVLTFALVSLGLLFSGIRHKLNSEKLMLFGSLFAIPLVLFNIWHFNNWIVFIGTSILIAVVSYGLCWIVNKYSKYKIFQDPLNLFIVAGQAIDGIASSIAITYFNFSEQHVFSNMVMNINPILFVGIKLAIAVLICWSLDDYLKDELNKHKGHEEKIRNKKNLIGFIKLIIAILGFATGLASLFKLGIIF